jgi:hypothetical protein
MENFITPEFELRTVQSVASLHAILARIYYVWAEHVRKNAVDEKWFASGELKVKRQICKRMRRKN